MQWQPIETAPKDGTRVLAVDGDGVISTAVYLQDWSESMVFIRAERDGDVFKKKVEEVGYWHMDADDACGATHWMPLPAPPDTQRTDPPKAWHEGDVCVWEWRILPMSLCGPGEQKYSYWTSCGMWKSCKDDHGYCDVCERPVKVKTVHDKP